MDGYSIKEAATVLGVPKRRVWELIARGVLSGAPEGDGGMRVFLQPRPGKASPLSAAREEPPRTNGNGGRTDAGEGSPFREILTEFRSLTERYGQALLALGEARGEVAALRSRVELLEARLDLRLPGPRPSSTVAWEMPEYTPPAPPAPEAPEAFAAAESPVAEVEPPIAEAEPVVEAESPVADFDFEARTEATEPTQIEEPRPPVPAADEPRPEKGAARRRRVLRSHSAIAGIAEALQRAQDPTLADLPGAREAAEALAALQREVEARTDTLEPEATIDEATAISEPETFIDKATAISEPEPQAEPVAEASFVEPAAATPAQELVDEEPSVDAQPPELVTEPAEETADQERVHEAEPQPEAAVEIEEAGAEPDAAGVGESEPEAAAPVGSAPSPYTTEVVEPDWFADGDFTWLEAAQAESASSDQTDEIALEEESAPQAVVQAAPAGESEEPEPLEMEAEADAGPAAEAIQDAFEPAEPDVTERETAVAAESPQPEPETVAEVAGAKDGEQVDQQQADEAQGTAEAAPAGAAIQDAFEEGFESADLLEPEGELHAEPEAPEADQPSEVIAAIEPEPETYAAGEEPEQESANEDAGPAAEAIQDAFEPTQPAAPAAEAPAATAVTREEPFAPADVAVFAVDQSEPEGAGSSDSEAQAQPPDARAEATSTELPPAPPRTEGLGGLAVQAAALPAVQPSTPARPAEEELMWLGDEFEEAGLEIAASGWHGQPQPAARSSVEPSVEPPVESPVEPALAPSVEPFNVAPRETHDAAAHGMSDAELQQIAQDEGWDADEVDAIRTLLGRPTPAQASEEPYEQRPASGSTAFSVDSPPPDDVHPMEEDRAQAEEPEPPVESRYEPSDELFDRVPMPPVDWPMAEPVHPEPPTAETTASETLVAATSPEGAAGATAREAGAADTSAPEPEPEPAGSLPAEESIRRAIAPRPAERRPSGTDPEWLRRRRGPAARAYRRLRRLLPG
jgi:hypothetical protein